MHRLFVVRLLRCSVVCCLAVVSKVAPNVWRALLLSTPSQMRGRSSVSSLSLSVVCLCCLSSWSHSYRMWRGATGRGITHMPHTTQSDEQLHYLYFSFQPPTALPVVRLSLTSSPPRASQPTETARSSRPLSQLENDAHYSVSRVQHGALCSGRPRPSAAELDHAEFGGDEVPEH